LRFVLEEEKERYMCDGEKFGYICVRVDACRVLDDSSRRNRITINNIGFAV